MAIKVLIVEDDPDIMMAVTHLMEGEGFEVASALDISVAEALLRVSVPDVAIIDHNLPDGTGADLCKKIIAAGDTRVIVYTAQARRDTVMGYVDCGAVDYVLKGSGIEELVTRVRKHAA